MTNRTAVVDPAAPAASARVVNKLDFERLLAVRGWVRSAHFALHHVSGVPMPTKPARYQRSADELSTGIGSTGVDVVDNFRSEVWLGCMVPKRHARRAVTRSLMKRQMRSVFDRHCRQLAGGLWLLRLRSAFDKGQFRSAASPALRAAVRVELESLLADAVRRMAATTMAATTSGGLADEPHA